MRGLFLPLLLASFTTAEHISQSRYLTITCPPVDEWNRGDRCPTHSVCAPTSTDSSSEHRCSCIFGDDLFTNNDDNTGCVRTTYSLVFLTLWAALVAAECAACAYAVACAFFARRVGQLQRDVVSVGVLTLAAICAVVIINRTCRVLMYVTHDEEDYDLIRFVLIVTHAVSGFVGVVAFLLLAIKMMTAVANTKRFASSKWTRRRRIVFGMAACWGITLVCIIFFFMRQNDWVGVSITTSIYGLALSAVFLRTLYHSNSDLAFSKRERTREILMFIATVAKVFAIGLFLYLAASIALAVVRHEGRRENARMLFWARPVGAYAQLCSLHGALVLITKKFADHLKHRCQGPRTIDRARTNIFKNTLGTFKFTTPVTAKKPIPTDLETAATWAAHTPDRKRLSVTQELPELGKRSRSHVSVEMDFA